MGGIPHFLAIPYPILGHVNPLMQLCQVLAKHGCKITFVNTEFNHKRAQSVMPGPGPEPDNLNGSRIKFVTLPDGLGPEDDRIDLTKILLSMDSTMPAMLPKLIQDINDLDVDNKISCIIVTMNMGWALEVGQNLGIKRAFLFPASATSMVSCYCIPRLIHDGIIDSDGLPVKKQIFQILPNMPMMETADLPWGGLTKMFFAHIAQEIQTLKSLAEWWICNTTCDLEPQPLSISPNFLPIGPFMEIDTNFLPSLSFWQEDNSCIDWLDQHPPQSVIYVSFGSLATLNPAQFKELVLALDLLDRAFLLVVCPRNDNNIYNAYPDEYEKSKGKIVNWAPQKKILNHHAIGCFISHCGWNSTTEGLFSGTPFLCWPICSDQFLNRLYICDVWKVGLGLEKDENGLITKEEIKKKVEQLLRDEDIKARSLKLKEKTISSIAKGGQSSKNIEKFIEWAKE